jgi:SOS-response transcriptional repressor LexA
MNWTGCLKNRSYRDLVRCLAGFERRGKSALTRDLEMELKRSNQLLQVQLAQLEEAGFISLDGGYRQSKRIELTDQGRAVARTLGARVLGTVPAGLLRSVPEGEGYDGEGAPLFLDTWDDLLPPTEDFSVLLVKGDSMIGDCIQDGDEVQLVRDVKLGELDWDEIAAVMVGDDYEATLKHVQYDAAAGTVRLRASNPKYDPIDVAAKEVRVVGAFYAIVRVSPSRRPRK